MEKGLLRKRGRKRKRDANICESRYLWLQAPALRVGACPVMRQRATLTRMMAEYLVQ